jgi:hypothetical protein
VCRERERERIECVGVCVLHEEQARRILHKDIPAIYCMEEVPPARLVDQKVRLRYCQTGSLLLLSRSLLLLSRSLLLFSRSLLLPTARLVDHKVRRIERQRETERERQRQRERERERDSGYVACA